MYLTCKYESAFAFLFFFVFLSKSYTAVARDIEDRKNSMLCVTQIRRFNVKSVSNIMFVTFILLIFFPVYLYRYDDIVEIHLNIECLIRTGNSFIKLRRADGNRKFVPF